MVIVIIGLCVVCLVKPAQPLVYCVGVAINKAPGQVCVCFLFYTLVFFWSMGGDGDCCYCFVAINKAPGRGNFMLEFFCSIGYGDGDCYCLCICLRV